MDKAIENRDFTKGNLAKKIILYFLPLLFASVSQLLFTTIDIFTVTKFGEGNVSSGAIGATNNLIQLILSIFWGLSAGASIVIANAKGAQNKENAEKAIGSITLIVVSVGILIMIGGSILAKPLLVAMKTDEIFLEKSTQYIVIYFLGAPLNLLFNAGASILRALGDTKRPLIAVIISGIANVVLDFAFVIFFKLDVIGVALATIISQAISALIVYYFLIKDSSLFALFKFKNLKFYKEESFDILRLGILSGLQTLIFNVTNVSIQSCVNEIGPEAVIGKTASSNIDSYEYALLNSISNTCLVAVGQNYGAKNEKGVKKSFLISSFLELTIVTGFCFLVFLLRYPLLSLFIRQNEPSTELATKYAIQTIMALGLPYSICGVCECCSAYLRGMKFAVAPTVVSLFSIVGVRMACIHFLFPLEFFHNYLFIFLLYPLSWIVCLLIYIPFLIVLGKKAKQSLNAKG